MYRYWGQTTVTQILDIPLLCFPSKFTPRYVLVFQTYLQRLEKIERRGTEILHAASRLYKIWGHASMLAESLRSQQRLQPNT